MVPIRDLARIACLLAVFVVCLVPAPVRAAFHLMVIEEVMSGFGGDPDVQYVELRMTAGGQSVVNNSKLTAFNADGSSFTVLITTPSNVSNGANGSRILYGTADFAVAAGVTPDFTIPSGILTPSGMICWGKPGANEGNPGAYIDCVAYGSYTGPTASFGGTPTHRPPGDGANVLGRVSTTDDNATDFLLIAPSPRNNAGVDGDLGTGGPTTTTTSTTTTTTTTTTLPLCGAAPEPSASCRLGTAGKSSVQYKDKDPGTASKSDSFKWKLGKLVDAVDLADFGTPTAATETYRVCVYDAGIKLVEMGLVPSGTCNGKPCWKSNAKGYSFKDKFGVPDGITNAKFKIGDAGKGQVQIKAKGVNLDVPTLPLAGPVVVQMIIDDGVDTECYQTEFTAPFKKSDATQLKAKGP